MQPQVLGPVRLRLLKQFLPGLRLVSRSETGSKSPAQFSQGPAAQVPYLVTLGQDPHLTRRMHVRLVLAAPLAACPLLATRDLLAARLPPRIWLLWTDTETKHRDPT